MSVYKIRDFDQYGNGRQSVIAELNHYIQDELYKLYSERSVIPRGTTDKALTYKRATLAGNAIALNRIKQVLKRKENNLKKKR